MQNHSHIIDCRHAWRPLIEVRVPRRPVSAGQTSARVRAAGRSRLRIPPRCAAAGPARRSAPAAAVSACAGRRHGDGDDPAVDHALHRLDQRRGQPAPGLDAGQMPGGDVASAQWAGQHPAAATASATARLIPTPPTGDIACAASPISNRPSVVPAPQPVELHVEQLDVVERRQRRDVVGQPRHQGHHAAVQRLDALRAQFGVAALGDDVGALVVVAAVDDDLRRAGAEHTGQAVRIVGVAREPEPPHVHRRPEASRLQAHRVAQRRRAAVAGDRQRAHASRVSRRRRRGS